MGHRLVPYYHRDGSLLPGVVECCLCQEPFRPGSPGQKKCCRRHDKLPPAGTEPTTSGACEVCSRLGDVLVRTGRCEVCSEQQFEVSVCLKCARPYWVSSDETSRTVRRRCIDCRRRTPRCATSYLGGKPPPRHLRPSSCRPDRSGFILPDEDETGSFGVAVRALEDYGCG